MEPGRGGYSQLALVWADDRLRMEVEAARAELECATDSVEKDRAVERLDVAVQRLTAFVLGE